MKITILSFENQTNADAMVALLQDAGHDCVVCDAAQNMPERLHDDACDLLVLIASRAEANVAAWIRAAKAENNDKTGGDLPVMAVVDASGFSSEALLDWLAVGVDDYLVQPVRRQELMLRVEVLLRRAWPEKMRLAQMQFGPFVFDTVSGKVRRNGQLIELAHKEFELALLFFRHLNQPLSRATLLERLWPGESEMHAASNSRTVDTHVSRVRNKLGLQDGTSFRLVPVYGYGYVLEQVGGGE